MEALYQKHKDQAAFLFVYIREAHSSDGWQTPANLWDGVVFQDPKTLGERQELAQTCTADLGVTFPTVVDEMDSRVEKAYAAWPDRLYIIDIDGRVAYRGAEGPRGFKTPEVAAALEKLLPERGAQRH